MKVLFNKLKKVPKVLLVIYILTMIAYLTGYIFLVINLIHLTGIETFWRIILIIVLGLWFIIYFFWNLINLILKKKASFIITTILSIILVVLFGIGSYYIGVINKGISNLTEKAYVTYTANLVTLKDTVIDKDSILGMINSSDDIEGNVLAKELIKKENLTNNKVNTYASYYEMIDDLLNGEVDGIFLNSNYLTIFGEEEGFEKLKDTVVAYTYSKKMENKDTKIVSNKSLTEPFTVLLMGVDSTADGLDASTSFNGDTLMLITFNPKTLNATMFSIPRDTYVPIACNHNRYAKINSSAAYGTSCVIDTVKQLTTIDIDYYLKVNFKAVVDLVEAIGGVEVDVEVPDYDVYYNAHNGRICEQNSLRQKGKHLVCMDTGLQKLNGEQALAYARCRHAFLQSDIARNRHQQQIVEAIAKQLVKKDNINKVEDILNAITRNLSTNMSQKQILSFYDVMKDMITNSFNDGDFITINKTYLEYYSLPVKLSNKGSVTSAIGHYPGSLEAIIKLMKVNLELEKKDIVKTFSFDANEEYTEIITGKGITTGDKLETMPNFIGKSVSEAEAWANSHNITFKTEFVDVGNSHYNASITPGLVADQSVSYRILVNNISELTIYINNATTTDNQVTDDNNEDINKPNDNPDNNITNDDGNQTDKDDNKENNDNKEPNDQNTDQNDEGLGDILPGNDLENNLE